MSPIALAECGWLPDAAIRWGIRRLLAQRLRDESSATPAEAEKRKVRLIAAMDESPIAVQTQVANEQHYELPAAFFRLVLGPHLKYSSGLWESSTTSMVAAEESMLELTSNRAQLADGQRILELGCGWGSWTLWIATRFPRARITAVSNSIDQRRYIERRAVERGIANLEVVTADMNEFDAGPAGFDRVISVEMFEHMRNYRELLRRIALWMRPDGQLFVHIFRHNSLAYFYEDDGPNDWMARRFFSGGMMPSEDLLQRFDDDLKVTASWGVSGLHYRETQEAWLRNLDRNRDQVLEVLESVYGKQDRGLWFRRWRIFFLACSELFGFQAGKAWSVGHYRLEKP